MTKAAAGVITHEVYRRTSLLFWRHTTSCSANSSQLANRREGALAIAAANTGSSPANSGRRAPIEGGGALTCWLITTAGLESSYGAPKLAILFTAVMNGGVFAVVKLVQHNCSGAA